jgi:DNA-binding GntR family transcriptional regulator
MEKPLQKLLEPPSLSSMAYDKLRESLLNGYLEPGKIYVETNLAKELGISRSPVREALLKLAAQGLVKFIPRKGVRITHYKIRDIEEVFEMRKAIELATVEKLCRLSKVLDFSAVERAFADQTEAAKKKDNVAFLSADREFHTALTSLTENSLFVQTQENLRDKFHVMAMEGLSKSGRTEEVLEEHRKIVEFVKEGVVQEAKQAMELHLDRSRQAVVDQYRPPMEE